MKRFIQTLIFFALIGLFALSSCKKDSNIDKLLVGKWAVKSSSITGYTLPSGELESNQDIQIIEGSTITFRTDGKYALNDQEAKYSFKYNSSTKELSILGPFPSMTKNSIVKTLDEHNLVLETTTFEPSLKSVLIDVYTR